MNFNPNIFNNIYWHLLAAFNNLAIRFIWVYGGSSASKTYSVVQLTLIKMLSGGDENTIVFRKFGVDIRDSIYADFKAIITEWGLDEYFTVQINYIRCNLTGSFVRFRGLDDSEKVKGIAGFKRVILEEISQFEETDLKQIRKRLRGKAGQQIICIFNPISEEHWIKKNVFDKEQLIDVMDYKVSVAGEVKDAPIAGMQINEKGNLVIMKTNYLDNIFIVGKWETRLGVDGEGKLVQIGGFVDQHTIDDFEKDKLDDHAYYQVYGLGNWGKVKTGGEFWKDFKYDKCTTDIDWLEEFPLFIWWDENVNPYLTCLIWQCYGPNALKMHDAGEVKLHPDIVMYLRAGKKVAVQIDEICLSDPNNRTRNVCMEFEKRYPQPRVRGLFVGGDRTSVKEDTKMEKGENFFTKILEHVELYKPTLRMQSSNPSVVLSAGFINQCYRGETNLVILINRKCGKSLHDYQYAPEDSDGTLKKVKKKNPATGIQYELWGHPSDAKRYMITVNFASEYEAYMKGGKKKLPIVGKNISRNRF